MLSSAGLAAPASRSRNLRVGVNRHSSSRPVGGGKSARSKLATRSARDASGFDLGAPSRTKALSVSVLMIYSLAKALLSARGGIGAAGQPTAPSICNSISRFSSRAYSIGSSRAIGSTKPRTIIAIASSSLIPRLIR